MSIVLLISELSLSISLEVSLPFFFEISPKLFLRVFFSSQTLKIIGTKTILNYAFHPSAGNRTDLEPC